MVKRDRLLLKTINNHIYKNQKVIKLFILYSLPDHLNCFGDYPNLELQDDNSQNGDKCIHKAWPDTIDWECPLECVKTSNNQAPFCVDSQDNERLCRVSKGIN